MYIMYLRMYVCAVHLRARTHALLKGPDGLFYEPFYEPFYGLVCGLSGLGRAGMGSTELYDCGGGGDGDDGGGGGSGNGGRFG